MLIQAPVVLPVSASPIRNGAVRILGNKITAVGTWADVPALHGEEIIRLEDQILLPGLINAHCHLDYSCMRDAIARPKSFSAWIKKLNSIKRQLSDGDIIESIARGVEEAQLFGTTTVCSMAAFPELMSRVPESPIRVWWFYEMIDIKHRVTSEEVVAGALSFFDQKQDPLRSFGLNPHAPYTASLLLYRMARTCAAANNMLLTTHVAESAGESDMFRHARGDLFEFLNEIDRPMHDCGHDTPFGWLWRNGAIGGDWILAHMNELESSDFSLLETLSTDALPHVVHCPGSHAYFGHRPFAFSRLKRIGVNLCIGTDSLASTNTLSLLEELRRLSATEPSLGADELLETVTLAPAKALRKHDKLGCIKPDALADMIAVPGTGSLSEAAAEVVNHRGPVSWMMVNGRVRSVSASGFSRQG
jgi:cytosine/adenosine deaminase-related metal-dependent hydrolase